MINLIDYRFSPKTSFFVISLLLPISIFASEYHLMLQGDHPEEHRRNTSYLHHAFQGDDLYLILAVNGVYNIHHGIMGSTQRLVKVTATGTLEWRASMPKGAHRLHTTADGFLVVAQHGGTNPKYGSRYREVEVWKLDREGDPVERYFVTTGYMSVVNSYLDRETLRIVLSGYEESSPETQLLLFDDEGRLQSRRTIQRGAGRTTIGNDYLSVHASGKLRSYDLSGEPRGESEIPDWSSHVTRDSQGGLYSVSYIKPPDPYFGGSKWHSPLKIRYQRGEQRSDYENLHDLDIRKIKVSRDGGLWILGTSDNFAAMLKFKDGQIVQSRRFNSRLAESEVSELIELEDDEVMIIGTTSLRYDFPKMLSDVFVVRTKHKSDFLGKYERCAANSDEITRLEKFLSLKGMIYPRWSSSETKSWSRTKTREAVSPFYNLQPATNAWLPPPDRCGGLAKHKYLEFLNELVGHVKTRPPGFPDQGFSIRLSVKDTPISGGYSEMILSVGEISLSTAIESADVLYEMLAAEIYPNTGDFQARRRLLYKQTGISLDLSNAGLKSMSHAIELYDQIIDSWQGISKTEKIQLESVFSRMYLNIDADRNVAFKYGRAVVDRSNEVERILFHTKDNADATVVDLVAIKNIFSYLLDVRIPRLQESSKQMAKEWTGRQPGTEIPSNYMMYESVKSGWFDSLKLALDSGADVNTESCWGNIMSHTVADNGHTDIAELLLKHGARVNQLGPNNETALHIALEERSLGIVRLLLEVQNLDLTLKDTEGRTALDVAVEYRYQIPDWVFDQLKARSAPGGGPTRRASRIIAGGSGCDDSGYAVPEVLIN